MSRRRDQQDARKAMSHRDGHVPHAVAPTSPQDVVERTAVAHGTVKMHPKTLEAIMDKKVSAGNVIEAARVAGMVAARKAADLVPTCHPAHLSHVHMRIEAVGKDRLGITADVRVAGQVGGEAEALVAVALAALTVHEMCRPLDPAIITTDVRLLQAGAADLPASTGV
jgi:cyclic pyranopterin phosphate synthase